MTPEEVNLCIELMQQDAEAKEARERRRYRAQAWKVIACLIACFWIMVIGGAWAWAGTVTGGVR